MDDRTRARARRHDDPASPPTHAAPTHAPRSPRNDGDAPAGLDGAAVADGWGHIRAGLRRDLGARSFDQWLGRARLVSCAAPHFDPVVAVPSPFILSWIEERHGERIRLAFRQCLPAAGRLRMVVDDGRDGTIRRIDVDAAPAPVPAATDSLPPHQPTPLAGRPLDARYSFDRFVTGDANRMATNAARALSGGAGEGLSPLFLHSATGQGKTHLAHAIGHRLIERPPGRSGRVPVGGAVHRRLRGRGEGERHPCVQGAAARRRPADPGRRAVHGGPWGHPAGAAAWPRRTGRAGPADRRHRRPAAAPAGRDRAAHPLTPGRRAGRRHPPRRRAPTPPNPGRQAGRTWDRCRTTFSTCWPSGSQDRCGSWRGRSIACWRTRG